MSSLFLFILINIGHRERSLERVERNIEVTTRWKLTIRGTPSDPSRLLAPLSGGWGVCDVFLELLKSCLHTSWLHAQRNESVYPNAILSSHIHQHKFYSLCSRNVFSSLSLFLEYNVLSWLFNSSALIHSASVRSDCVRAPISVTSVQLFFCGW